MRTAARVAIGIGLAGLLTCGGALALSWQRVAGVADVLAAIFEEPDWAEIPDADAMLRYLASHPDDVSLVVLTVDPDGVARTELAHRPDAPRVLASTVKIVVLSAWARAVEQGAIDPAATVRLGDWDSWYLHGLDGGAHPRAYDRLQIPHDDGIARAPDRRVPLEDVVGAMIQESDNAATDLVIATLGPGLAAELDALGHAPVAPLLADMVEAMAGDPCVTRAPVDLHDPVVRAEQLAEGVPPVGLRDQRARLGCVLPRSSAALYASVMAGVVSRTHISPAGSERMAAHLEWPMAFPGNQAKFHAFGSKGGCVPGVITEASYLIPRDGDFAGERRVVALFMNEMSGSAWMAGMGSFAHQDLLVRLATDAAFEQEVRAALGAP